MPSFWLSQSVLEVSLGFTQCANGVSPHGLPSQSCAGIISCKKRAGFPDQPLAAVLQGQPPAAMSPVSPLLGVSPGVVFTPLYPVCYATGTITTKEK